MNRVKKAKARNRKSTGGPGGPGDRVKTSNSASKQSRSMKKKARHNKRVNRRKKRDLKQLHRSGNKKRYIRKSKKKSRTYKM